MIRVIEPSPAGLKSLHDFERLWGIDQDLVGPSGQPLDRSQCWDVATLAVAAEYRSAASAGLISMALYQAINMLGAARGVNWAIAVMDVVVLDLINAAWHRPFAPVQGSEPLTYLDSPASLPVFCEVADYRARLSFLDPATHAILFEGQGLESMVSAPAWGRRSGWTARSPPPRPRARSSPRSRRGLATPERQSGSAGSSGREYRSRRCSWRGTKGCSSPTASIPRSR
jgi:hypothetical protein